MNDDVESIVVGSGCSAVIAEHGEHDGWDATLSDKGGSSGNGRYTIKDLEAVGAKPNDVSSLVRRCHRRHSRSRGRAALTQSCYCCCRCSLSAQVVHHDSDETKAREVHAEVKDKREKGIPQRGQIDQLDWSNFDEFMSHRPDKMVRCLQTADADAFCVITAPTPTYRHPHQQTCAGPSNL